MRRSYGVHEGVHPLWGGLVFGQCFDWTPPMCMGRGTEFLVLGDVCILSLGTSSYLILFLQPSLTQQ